MTLCENMERFDAKSNGLARIIVAIVRSLPKTNRKETIDRISIRLMKFHKEMPEKMAPISVLATVIMDNQTGSLAPLEMAILFALENMSRYALLLPLVR